MLDKFRVSSIRNFFIFSKFKFLILFLSGVGLLIGFQNCGQSFQSTGQSSLSSSVAQNSSGFVSLGVNQDKSVFEGEAITLSSCVTPMNGATLSYQWLFNGNEISGQTSPDLKIDHAQKDSLGSYAVKVTIIKSNDPNLINKFEIIQVSHLNIFPVPKSNFMPSITSFNGGDVNLNAGDSYFLKIGHQEYPAGSIKWFKDGHLLEGQTQDVLSFFNVAESDQGSYRAEIQNSQGTVQSSEAKLIVMNLPTSMPEPTPVPTSELAPPPTPVPAPKL